MAYHNPAGYGAPARPYNYDQPAPNCPPTEQWQRGPLDKPYHEYGYPLADDIHRVHQPAVQIQRYQQQLQALNRTPQQHLQTRNRPYQQQVYRHRLDGSSSHYAEPYESQGQYSQAQGYGDVQHSHALEEYEYSNQDGSSTRSQQTYHGLRLAQQPALLGQEAQYDRSVDPRRTKPPPQRSHSDEGLQQPNDRSYLSNMRPPAPTGQQVPSTTFEAASNTKLRNGYDKSAKGRILTSPISPETLSWDNPFPTFPTNKKKVVSHDTDRRRPVTASSSRDHEAARAQPLLIASERIQEANLQQSKQGSTIPPPTSGAGGGAPSLDVTRKPENGYHARFNRQKSPNDVPQPVKRSDELYSLPSSPWQSTFASGDLSNIPLPAHAPEPMTYSSLPFRDNGPAQGLDRVYAAQPLPLKDNDMLYQPVNHADSIPSDYRRVRSHDMDQGPYSRDGQFQHPMQKSPSIAEESYDDHLDSYYQPMNEPPPAHPTQQTRLEQPLGDEDMPNFNVIPEERCAHGSRMTIDQQLHLGPQQPVSSVRPVTDMDRRGRSNDHIPAAAFTGQANRSKSQPDYRDQRQPMNQNEGFIQDAMATIPPLPAINSRAAQAHSHGGYIDAPSLRAPQRPPCRLHQLNSESRRQFPLPQGSRQTYNNSLPVPQTRSSLDSWREDPGQGRNPPEKLSQDSRRGPASQLADERPTMSLLVGQSQGPSLTSDDNSRPLSAPRRTPSNPDALPEHPSPVPSGISPAMHSIQPKPAPVRQYNGVALPADQPNLSQTTRPRRSIGNAEALPVTHEELQRLRQLIKVYPNDQKSQLLLSQKMVEAASVLADEGGRADAKTRNKNREKYIFDAHKIVKKLVSGGYPEAMFYLADCHGRGLLGLQADPKEAFGLYQSAAKLGHAQSAYRVAVCCEMGQDEGGGTRKDPLKAVQWYKRAATLGDSPAMYKMGMILLKGLLGQPKNTREAIVWLKRAAERADEENPHSLHELGLLYESATGNDNIIRDEAYSKQLFLQAAELGYKFSQYRLGSAYEYGHLGCPIDPRQSIAWYSRAAVQEEHQSELALSGWYLTGSEGVLQQSDTEAYLWARKAALAGLAKAEYAMGYFTEVGIGATANMDDAKRWYWRASSQNFLKARERLEDLRKGGARIQKSRVSRSAVNKQSDGDCSVM